MSPCQLWNVFQPGAWISSGARIHTWDWRTGQGRNKWFHLKKYIVPAISGCCRSSLWKRIQWSVCLRGFSVWSFQAGPSVWSLVFGHSGSSSNPPVWMHACRGGPVSIHNDHQIRVMNWEVHKSACTSGVFNTVALYSWCFGIYGTINTKSVP